jgi:organic radical activating enzyme
MKIKEIYYSIQSEGLRTGTANIFVRLSGCNINCEYCDYDHFNGQEITMFSLLKKFKEYPCKNIIWTGGEPTLQLTEMIVRFFKKEGYFQAIETNGSKPIPDGLDFISCSPKVSNMALKMSFRRHIDEYKFPMQLGSNYPHIDDIPRAKAYFISPIFSGEEKRELDDKLFDQCIGMVKQDPRFRLSVKNNKLWCIE